MSNNSQLFWSYKFESVSSLSVPFDMTSVKITFDYGAIYELVSLSGTEHKEENALVHIA